MTGRCAGSAAGLAIGFVSCDGRARRIPKGQRPLSKRSPGPPVPRPVRPVIERDGDPQERCAAVPQAADFGERSLLGWARFQVLAVIVQGSPERGWNHSGDGLLASAD